MEVTWTGSKPYSVWHFQTTTCTVSRDWLQRKHFEGYASEVHSWLLEAERAAGLRVVCGPSRSGSDAPGEF